MWRVTVTARPAAIRFSSASLAFSSVMVGAVLRLSGQVSEPRSLNRHGRRRPTIHEFAGQGLGLSSAFRLATSFAKQENGSRRARRDSRDHGGERRLTLHSHFSVHLLGQLRVLRVKIPAVAPTRSSSIRSGGNRQLRRISDQRLANSWMVGPLPSRGQASRADHDGRESKACRPQPNSRGTSSSSDTPLDSHLSTPP
jgi:hypothetical protein